MDVNLNGDYFVNPFSSIEPGAIVGPGERWPSIAALPSVILYPGKPVYDKNVDVLYYINADMQPVPFIQLPEHLRIKIIESTITINLLGVHVKIMNICINHMPYYGIFDDGNADVSQYDYAYAFSSDNTIITFNDTLLTFRLQVDMLVDIVYIAML